jgi:hypothetical protein
LDSHNSALVCDTLPESAEGLDTLHVTFEAAGGYQAAESALSEAVAKQKEEMKRHADHGECMIEALNDDLLDVIHGTEELIKILMEFIFEDTAPVPDETA